MTGGTLGQRLGPVHVRRGRELDGCVGGLRIFGRGSRHDAVSVTWGHLPQMYHGSGSHNRRDQRNAPASNFMAILMARKPASDPSPRGPKARSAQRPRNCDRKFGLSTSSAGVRRRLARRNARRSAMIHGLDTGFLVAAEVRVKIDFTPRQSERRSHPDRGSTAGLPLAWAFGLRLSAFPRPCQHRSP